MKRIPWFERRFDFDSPATMYTAIVERLRGTPARIEDRVRSMPVEILTRRHGERWSIQENIGHLLDLEPLWYGRVDDLYGGAENLRPADLENRKTHEADHNAAPIFDLLVAFRSARTTLVERLDTIGPDEVDVSAMHPRLNQPMRLVDLVLFVAEHDDHHLVTITDLIHRFGG